MNIAQDTFLNFRDILFFSISNIISKYNMKFIGEQIEHVDFCSLFICFISHRKLIAIGFGILIVVKLLLLFLLAITCQKNKDLRIPILLLMFSLISYVSGSIAWISYLVIAPSDITQSMISRTAWQAQPLLFYALGIFLDTMRKSRYALSRTQKIFLIMFSIYPLIPVPALIIFPTPNKFFLTSIGWCVATILFRLPREKELIISAVGLLFLTLQIVRVLKKIDKNQQLPHILKLQIKSFIMLISTFLVAEFILLLANFISTMYIFYNNKFFSLFSSTLFTASIVFYARRIYQLRFLNLLPSVVHTKKECNTNDELCNAKKALCVAQSVSVLHYINAEFFKKIQGVESERVIFCLRMPELQKQLDHQYHDVLCIVEKFRQEHEAIATLYFSGDALLVYDELAFTHFYEQSDDVPILLSFLEEINASVFIPLQQNERMLGFIMIKQRQAHHDLFPLAIQNQMKLYGTYVAYTIMRLEQKQHQELLVEHQRLSLDLYKAHQKIAHYRESLSSIMKGDDIKKMGLILYKSGSFSFINPAAEELVQIDPNKYYGHPLTKVLKEIARCVTVYKTNQKMVEKNSDGIDICCYGIPYKNEDVFIMVFPADVLQRLKEEHTLIQPCDIDYFVFLQVTEAGKMLNQMLPGSGETLRRFKLQFLKIVQSKKSMVFDVHQDDTGLFIGFVQRILGRQTVHTIDVREGMATDSIAKELFGSPIFNADAIQWQRGILDVLDETGILCINNVHLLDQNTQNFLAQYIKTGSFTRYKSEQRVVSNVTIIFLSQENLEEYTKNSLFSKALFEQIQEAIVSFPTLSLLPFGELESLAREMVKQMIVQPEFHQLFDFSLKEQELLDAKRFISIYELRNYLMYQLKQKLAQNPAVNEAVSTQAQGVNNQLIKEHGADPLLLEAVRLGKHALRDRKIMRALWEKFKSQSKIAQLLGVDRSSVHRRCKEFGMK